MVVGYWNGGFGGFVEEDWELWLLQWFDFRECLFEMIVCILVIEGFVGGLYLMQDLQVFIGMGIVLVMIEVVVIMVLFDVGVV